MSTTFPDDALLDRVDELGPTEWSGTVHRHTGLGRDPLSGDGARLHGGRWNPPGRPTIYMAQPTETCIGEFERMAQATSIEPASLIRRGWALHHLQVTDLPVLELTADDALAYVGLDLEDIRDDDMSACQTVGEAAHFLAFAGVVAPSATGNGIVVVGFEDRIRPGQLALLETEPLDDATYERLR